MHVPDGPASNSEPLFLITGNRGPGGAEGTTTTSSSSPRGFFYSHPKLLKLEEVVLEHFREHQSSASASTSSGQTADTRVMIFSQYRESVQEIADMLSQHRPLIKVMTFVGHSAGKTSSKGLTQKEQTEVCMYNLYTTSQYLRKFHSLLFSY